MKNFLKKDIVQRVVWTFIEGFLGGFVVTLSTVSNYDETILKSAFVGGIAGAISAVKTLIVNRLEKESE